VARAHRAGRGLTPAERAGYSRAVKSHAGVFQKLIAAFYDDDAFDVFMTDPVPFDIARGITSIVAGHAQLTWGQWWRFKLFLTICRLQPHWKIVKPRAPDRAASAAPAAG
jgi:hypothetical protein